MTNTDTRTDATERITKQHSHVVKNKTRTFAVPHWRYIYCNYVGISSI